MISWHTGYTDVCHCQDSTSMNHNINKLSCQQCGTKPLLWPTFLLWTHMHCMQEGLAWKQR